MDVYYHILNVFLLLQVYNVKIFFINFFTSTLCLSWSDTKIKIYINKTKLNRTLYHFYLTNYYLFNINYTNFNKTHSTVFVI